MVSTDDIVSYVGNVKERISDFDTKTGQIGRHFYLDCIRAFVLGKGLINTYDIELFLHKVESFEKVNDTLDMMSNSFRLKLIRPSNKRYALLSLIFILLSIIFSINEFKFCIVMNILLQVIFTYAYWGYISVRNLILQRLLFGRIAGSNYMII